MSWTYPPEYIGDTKLSLPETLPKFYLVRHGETSWNRDGRTQGSKDIPLNETGKQQARALAPLIASLRLPRAITSPLKRAHETSILATAGADIDIKIGFEALLQERHFGDFEGTTPDPKIFKGNFGNAELTEEFSRRVAEGLEKWTKEGDILFFVHGGVIRAVITLLDAEFPDVALPPTSVICFERITGGWKASVVEKDL